MNCSHKVCTNTSSSWYDFSSVILQNKSRKLKCFRHVEAGRSGQVLGGCHQKQRCHISRSHFNLLIEWAVPFQRCQPRSMWTVCLPRSTCFLHPYYFPYFVGYPFLKGQGFLQIAPSSQEGHMHMHTHFRVNHWGQNTKYIYFLVCFLL